MKTSMAWQDFRRSNQAATGVSSQDGDDSAGAEGDGFAGITSHEPEDMIVELMDKSFHAGEALAEREHDVRQLSKQVKAAKATNQQLETEVARLTTSNEKLADDEGRWHSIARELQSRMEAFRKVYGAISATGVQDKSNDGSGEDVDEQRQHSTALDQLRWLKSATREMEDALAAARDNNSAVELAKEQAQTREAEVRNRLQARVSELEEEIVVRDANSQSEQSALRDASAKQAQELRQALEEITHCRAACATAEATAQAGEDARCAAVEIATTIQAQLEGAQEDVKLAQEGTQTVTGHLAEARAAVETSQTEAKRRHEAQGVAETSAQQLSQRVVELETLLQDTRLQASQAEGDLADSSQKLTELSKVAHTYRGQVAEATTNLGELRSHADAQERRLRESLQRVTELTDDVQTLRAQLKEKDAAASRAEGDAERVLHGTSVAIRQAEGLRKEVERLKAGAMAMKREYAEQAAGLGNELLRVTARASREHAAHAQELRDELANTKQGAASVAEESAAQAEESRRHLAGVYASAARTAQENAVHVLALRQELERANVAVLTAQDNATNIEGLRRDLSMVNAELCGAQDEITRVNEARMAAEADARRSESARVGAEMAWEESRQQGAQLTEDVRALKAQLSEARASATHLEAEIEEQRGALEMSSLKVNQLEKRAIAVERARDEEAPETAASATVGAPGPLPVVAAPVFRVNGDTCANVLFGVTAPANNGNAPTGGKEQASAIANGVAPCSTGAEAEQLQAHAEAMELELRFTWESFQRQLSAMAREKVAIQKQVKEVTGQCTTLRKQVSHYKKVAKEREATEQHEVIELRARLEEAQRTLVEMSQELAAKTQETDSSRALANTLEHRMQEVESDMLGLRKALESASQELSAKEREAVSARALADTLKHRVHEVESEVLASQKTSEATEEELASALASASKLQSALSKVSELESVVRGLEGEKLHLNETTEALASRASAKLLELQEVIRSQKEEKAIASQTFDEAEGARATLMMTLRDIAELVGCERSGEAVVSSLRIADKITEVKQQLATAEDVLEATAQALLRTAVEGEVALGSGWSWITRGVTSLQRRMQVAESELSRRAVAQDDGGLRDRAQTEERSTSAVVECNGNTVMHEVALRQAKEEVETVKATLRKERLLMVAFRRWGHFYLALSNEALKKRTKEKNQARSRRAKPEITPSSMMEQTRNDTGRSRRRGGGREPLQLTSSEVRLMVEKEAVTVARELAGAPTASLLALVDARKDMDDVSMKAQATLGVLYSQPPLTQDADVAKDGSMMRKIERLPHEEGEALNALPSPGRQMRASANISVEAAGANLSEEALPEPPTAPIVPISQQESEAAQAADLAGVTRALNNAPPGRTTGPLVEDGVSKKERAEFLKRQREERKLNRKKGMQASSGSAGFRNRRTSAPATMTPAAVDAPPGPRTPPTLHREANFCQATPKTAIEDKGSSGSKRIPPPCMAFTAGVSPKDAAPTGEGQQGGGPSSRSDSTPTGEAVPPFRASPPRMFNPMAVPPPIAPPSATTSSHAPPPMHPSMAFNVNETVERALTEARRDAGLAERNATFWKCRLRDLAVWAASFVILTYASDHGFEGC
ncbi:conserved unknown protein [Ectocarpus siliculosus]|uniref:Uncharacterized protein n=1 Tax=Ectocarpus siliculosus TaxID=2880 RepID=D7FYN2_ECTSI|nr:conserved unknown protein [Ectocarpus siliculosus]|eukprot:CBJ32574.1 conserved unknown protein [Ectocarpus siliculosus]